MPATPSRRHFFVSYTRKDEDWATWIAAKLEEAGYSVFIQAWDFSPGANFVIEMQQAATLADRTIAVLSPDFLDSRFTPAEWAAAFAQDPTGGKRSLVPVRVRPCELTGILAQIIYIDLVGVDEGTARERLLAGVNIAGKPRLASGFPGARAQKAEGHKGQAFPSATPAGTAPGASRSAALREQISRKLRSDSDLDAFCLDYFPAVKRRFSNGMDRISKVNLLLEQADPDHIAAALRDVE